MGEDLLDWTNHMGHIVDRVAVEVESIDRRMSEDMMDSIDIAQHK